MDDHQFTRIHLSALNVRWSLSSADAYDRVPRFLSGGVRILAITSWTGTTGCSQRIPSLLSWLNGLGLLSSDQWSSELHSFRNTDAEFLLRAQ